MIIELPPLRLVCLYSVEKRAKEDTTRDAAFLRMSCKSHVSIVLHRGKRMIESFDNCRTMTRSCTQRLVNVASINVKYVGCPRKNCRVILISELIPSETLFVLESC